MKGILFTLDAIFGLIIALAAVGVIVFFYYSTQTPYVLAYSNVQVVIQNLLSANIDSLQNSTLLIKSMQNQFLGANETAPEFLGGAQRNSSNNVGPLEPILTAVYYTGSPANTITTGIIAGYGNIYFAASNILYAVNATTNMTAWTKNIVTNVVSTPVLYQSMLIYANYTNLTALNPRTGSQIWISNVISKPSSIAPVTSAMIAYNNRVYLTGSDNSFRAFYISNGSAVWSTVPTASPIVSQALLKGNLEIKTASNLVGIVVQASASANLLVSNTYALTNPPTNNIAVQGSSLYFGSGSSANSISTNGIIVGSYPLNLGAAVTGVAVYKNYGVYQYASGVAALSPTGTSYWNVAVPSYFGVALENATPVVSGQMVYTIWANGVGALNLSTGAIQWFATYDSSFWPSSSTGLSAYMTLAYGRLYVDAGSKIFVYGSCSAPAHTSVLAAAASMYYNSQYGCGSALLNSVYPMLNYSLSVGYPSVAGLVGYWPLAEGAGNAPTNTVNDWSGLGDFGKLVNSPTWLSGASCILQNCLSFSSASSQFANVLATNAISFASTNTQFSVAFWFYPTTSASIQSLVSKNGACSSCLDSGYGVRLESGGDVSGYMMNGGAIECSSQTPSAVSLNAWHYVVFINTGYACTLYVDNVAQPSGSVTQASIYSTQPLMLGADSNNGGAPALLFTGRLNDVRIYSRALSIAEAKRLYSIGTSPSAATNLNAYSLQQGNIRQPTVSVATFNGVTSYINLGNPAQLQITGGITLAAWVEYNGVAPTSPSIIDKGMNPSPLTGSYGLWLTGNVPTFGINSGGSVATVTSTNSIPANTFHFIAGVYNGTKISIYVDGVIKGNAVETGAIANTGSNVIIGDSSNHAHKLGGYISDVQIYAKGLSGLQIAQLYQRGMAGVPLQSTNLAAWYPLDGDPNDYAQFNPGFTSAITYTSFNNTPRSFANSYQISKTSTLLPLLNYSTGVTDMVPVGVYSWRS